MKKLDKPRYLKIQLKRERKRFKRIRNPKLYLEKSTAELKETTFKKSVDKQILKSFNFSLNQFLDDRGNKPIKPLTKEFKIPELFSLEDNYDETILKLALIRKSLLIFLGGKFVIDFTNCKKADFSGLFLLKVILDEYIKELKRLDDRLLHYKAAPTIKIQHSKNEDVNLKLLANALINNAQAKETAFIPISILNLVTGRKNQRHYAENKKGSAATTIREYINVGLRRHNLELNPIGDGYLDGLISEILNNAEDHSLFDKWYAFANLFETKRNLLNTEVVGEINLAFLNFGYSIYEGFEETKKLNFQVYNEMDAMCGLVSSTSKGKAFTKENLFTLYALQEGNSRLRYAEESRGTGTMKFINSFLNLGDYEDEAKGFKPHLMIYSGSTVLICDNKYRPFEIEGAYYLSLNKENDMTVAPESSHLRSLKNRFPGTLLTGKIYLNESHLKKKIEKNGN